MENFVIYKDFWKIFKKTLLFTKVTKKHKTFRPKGIPTLENQKGILGIRILGIRILGIRILGIRIPESRDKDLGIQGIRIPESRDKGILVKNLVIYKDSWEILKIHCYLQK